MHYTLFAAIFPVMIAAAIYFMRHQRASLPLLIVTPIAMLACAAWSVIPGLPRFAGQMELYHELRSTLWSNIFFLHVAIRAMENRWIIPYAPIFNVLFTIIVALPMLAAWRELRIHERSQQEET